MKTTIYIGIDTGDHTGFAVWDGQRFVELATYKIHQAMERVKFYAIDCGLNVKVFFEDARQRKYLPKEMSQSQYRGKLMGAGSVKRDANIWEDFLADYRIPYEAVAPHRGMTKYTAERFANVTGWEGRTSEHARDAGLLVYGR